MLRTGPNTTRQADHANALSNARQQRSHAASQARASARSLPGSRQIDTAGGLGPASPRTTTIQCQHSCNKLMQSYGTCSAHSRRRCRAPHACHVLRAAPHRGASSLHYQDTPRPQGPRRPGAFKGMQWSHVDSNSVPPTAQPLGGGWSNTLVTAAASCGQQQIHGTRKR